MTPEQIYEYLEYAGLAVALASAIAAAIPGESDNRIVAVLAKIVDAFALNFRERNPRKVAEKARAEAYKWTPPE